VGWADPRVVEATRRAIAEETDRSTGTVGRLRRRVAQLLAEAAAETGDPAPPAVPRGAHWPARVDATGLGARRESG